MEFNIENLVNLYYILSVTCLTYLILLLVINTTRKYVKVIVSLISGIMIGLVFYYFKLANMDTIISSFFISIVGYEWIIKYVLNKFNITPNNSLGFKL